MPSPKLIYWTLKDQLTAMEHGLFVQVILRQGKECVRLSTMAGDDDFTRRAVLTPLALSAFQNKSAFAVRLDTFMNQKTHPMAATTMNPEYCSAAFDRKRAEANTARSYMYAQRTKVRRMSEPDKKAHAKRKRAVERFHHYTHLAERAAAQIATRVAHIKKVEHEIEQFTKTKTHYEKMRAKALAETKQ